MTPPGRATNPPLNAGTATPSTDDKDQAVTDPGQDDPITDSGGYLTCGCHGTQREHTCTDY